MKHISSSPEVSLAAVRHLSENAVCRPWERRLCCLPWPARSAAARLVPVWQPWSASAASMWRGFGGGDRDQVPASDRAVVKPPPFF